MLRITAPAKVNLHLAIGARRADGYHELVGVFHALELADVVCMEPAGALALECNADVGAKPRHNLAYRAAEAMGAAFEREPAVRIVLEKRIPHGAGLGGGSSDAAAVIAGLATMWGVDPEDPRCLAAGSSVGADVPFFLTRGGCALMTGRGDVIERAVRALDGVPIVLVKPPEPVSTAAAYAAFDDDPQPAASPAGVIAALENRDVAVLGAALFNNMTAASAAVVPAVAEALAWIRSHDGVFGAAVAGSGSAVFAMVGDGRAAQVVASAGAAKGWWTAATSLAASGVQVHGDTRGFE